MKTTTGTNFALGVAVLFAAACDSPKPTDAKPTPSATAAPPKADPVKSNEAPSPDPKKESEPTAEPTVHCLGIHECKGKSACHITGGHACAGQNACKGKGWIVVPTAECEKKGGKVVES